MIKNCVLCGKPFETRNKGNHCPGPHYRKCEVCGKMFQLKGNGSNDKRIVCSKECKHIRRLKLEESKGSIIKTCIICGREFRTNWSDRTICNDHEYATCNICGKEFKIYSRNRVTLTCDNPECLVKAKELRMLDKYGVRNVGQVSEFQDRKIQTMQKRYGVSYTLQNDGLKNKVRDLHRSKYGVDWPLQRQEVRDKSRETCLTKYGVENVFCNGDTRNAIIETWKSVYGVDNPFKSEEVKDKIKQTCLEKYGVEFAHQNLEIRMRTSQTRIQQFADRLTEPFRSEYLKFKQDPKSYIESAIENDDTVDAYVLSSRLGYTDPTTMLEIFDTFGFTGNRSKLTIMEAEIYDAIHQFDPNVIIDIHNRMLLGEGKELDLYLPQYKIGIECNPTITHNSTISYASYRGFSDTPPIPSTYHKNKSLLGQSEGIFVFHVFGYEWKYRKNVILSMLRNLIHTLVYRYYARNLRIDFVGNDKSQNFLDVNHRQGSTKSKINLGLYTSEGELVSLMTFGPTRVSLGRQKSDDNTTWELLRFCNKLNTSVVGGASKLFKYFLHNYNWSKIVSYSDVAHTRGNLYEILGFDKVHTSDPGYCWVNLNTDLYLNRVSCQKQNLPKLFNEPNLDIKNQTEQQIMVSHGFVQVFDSGVIRWEYLGK